MSTQQVSFGQPLSISKPLPSSSTSVKPYQITQFSHADLEMALDMTQLKSIYKYKDHFINPHFLENLKRVLEHVTLSDCHLHMENVRYDLKWMPLNLAEEVINNYAKLGSQEDMPVVVSIAKKCLVRACYFESRQAADDHFKSLREAHHAIMESRIKLSEYQKQWVVNPQDLLKASITSTEAVLKIRRKEMVALMAKFDEDHLEAKHYEWATQYTDSPYSFVADEARKCCNIVQGGNIPHAVIEDLLTSFGRHDLYEPFLQLIEYYGFVFKSSGCKLTFTHLSSQNKEYEWYGDAFKGCSGPYELEDEMLSKLPKNIPNKARYFVTDIITHSNVPDELKGNLKKYRGAFINWMTIREDKVKEMKDLMIKYNHWDKFNFTSDSFTVVAPKSGRKFYEVKVLLNNPELVFDLNIFTFQARMYKNRWSTCNPQESFIQLKAILEGKQKLPEIDTGLKEKLPNR